MSGYVALFTSAELSDFVGGDAVRRILDDNRDGTADAGPMAAVIKAASAHVLSGYYQTFDEVPDVAAIPAKLNTLGLHAGKAYLAIRHPEYVRYDGYKILEYVDKQIDALVAGNRRLGETPDPAANQGGEVYGKDPDDLYCYENYFQSGGHWTVF